MRLGLSSVVVLLLLAPLTFLLSSNMSNDEEEDDNLRSTLLLLLMLLRRRDMECRDECCLRAGSVPRGSESEDSPPRSLLLQPPLLLEW